MTALRRHPRLLVSLGVLLVLAAGALAFLLLRGPSAAAQAAKVMKAAGCTFATYRAGSTSPAYTTLPPTDPDPFASFPPTTGRAYVDPVGWGIYDQPVNEYQVIRNLQLGGVVVQWGDRVPRQAVAALRRFAAADPDGIVAAPLATLADSIVFSAWTHLAVCKRFDAVAAAGFRDRLRYRGPVDAPRGSLMPGE
ncbi:MAG: DUF3105 domain-containing protein [Actinomycetes bacterium]